jgi:uncharacterized protein (TIGR02453 family)
MPWFTPEFEKFLKELKSNNDKDWFNANKKRYEKDVKIPFEKFIGDMILRMQMYDPKCRIQPKDAIFRIYRDVRFSKDKTPYKIQVSAVVSTGGRKDMTLSGMYLEMGDKHLRIYGGVYMPDKDQLQAIRQEILYNQKDFESLISEKQFKKHFGEIRGEKNKRFSTEFAEIQDQQPLIANKQFYYFSDLDPSLITSDSLVDKLYELYEISQPIRQFLHPPLQD